MTPTDQHFKRLQEKLQGMLREYSMLQKENAELKKEVEDLRAAQRASASTAEELKQQVEILKFSAGTMEDEERKQFQKRLTAYIKEIDRCITMLGQ